MLKGGVYLAGKMEQVPVEDMREWRWTATQHFRNCKVPVYDPTRRIPLHTQIKGNLEDERKTLDTCRRVFKLDLQDIANSTVILADIRRTTIDNGPINIGTGTAMEVMFAHTKNKIIICWANPGDPIHPFMEAVATEKHYTLNDSVDACLEYFDIGGRRDFENLN